MRRYWVEYDGHGAVWLVDMDTEHRIALEHGMVLDVTAAYFACECQHGLAPSVRMDD